MMLEFYKMTGAEHDFVMVDNRELEFSSVLNGGNAKDICNRRFGIGADGLIVVEPAQVKRAVRLRHFNAEGAETPVDADGARCFVAFVDFLLDGSAKKIRFETPDGMVSGMVNDDDSVSIEGGKPGPALIVFRGEVVICEG